MSQLASALRFRFAQLTFFNYKSGNLTVTLSKSAFFLDAMIESTWTILAIKLVSVPILIWTVSSVARRWGPSVGGLLLGLPLTSGPVLFFLTLEQGTSFVSVAAQGTLMGLISLSIACLVYSKLSFRTGWLASMVGSGIAYFAVSLSLNFLSANLALT
ncbi:MAG TPA: hypothetical protein VJZ75_00580, partial [Candidatus Bathyarchaeia archaeon]|nr:hypothetical protein [Candidatus Bathyarchaeia archaeon]